MTITLQNPELLRTGAYIDGQWVQPAGNASFQVTNPATGECIAAVADLGARHTTRAIEAAQRAMLDWRQRPAKERSQLLRHWYDLVMANQEDLALLMTAEQGKVLEESRAEVAYGASFIEWFAEEAKRLYGDVIPGPNDRRQVVIKQPVGVVAAITPWNFPNAMITRKAGPALAAGCSIVIKPAAETPLSALALAELADRAGIPAGVINVVTGIDARAIGKAMTDSPVVRKLTFTGSTPVGKQLLQQSAASVKKVSMELGGNAPILVFDDADLDQAVAGALASKYRNAGQTCICVNRVLVQDSVYDEFADRFVAAVAKFELGNGLREQTTLGPLITAQAANDVHDKVQQAVAAGASIALGGEHAGELGECFYRPTVLTNVSPQMPIFREEIFGPVAPIFSFRDEAQAIAMANDTEFGLASYVYTRDIGRVWRVSEGIDYGMVGVNEVGITSELIPFGGMKESGVGREGSKYGIDDYIETKYICMGGLDA